MACLSSSRTRTLMTISKAAAAYEGTLKTLATDNIAGYRSTEKYQGAKAKIETLKSRHGVIVSETRIGHPGMSPVD